MRLFAFVCLFLCLSLAAGRTNIVCAAPADAHDAMYDPFEKTGSSTGAAGQQVSDPLEKFNRGMFVFNDKLYYWVLKPTAQGYSYVVPEPARMCVKRFFLNLITPVRMVNCLLQGKFTGAGVELTRFVVNSTSGIGGLFDPSYYCWGLTRQDEDTGRTLGRYGVGHGIYIVWPLFGPSSARDTVGMVGDTFLDPLSYVNLNLWERAGIEAYQKVNTVSLKIDEYDEFKKGAVDPYISLRSAYLQNRQYGLEK
jgi:phospholipid-binding lipoprotein MlaA